MLNYRRANLDDIEKLVELRKKQLVDEGLEHNNDIDTELSVFFKEKLSEGEIIQWLVEDGEEIIACGAVIFYDFPPSFTNKTGKKAYIANMYTNENYRGHGLATNLLSKLVDEVKLIGISRIWLEASKMGSPVYKKFGFKEADKYLELNIT